MPNYISPLPANKRDRNQKQQNQKPWNARSDLESHLKRQTTKRNNRDYKSMYIEGERSSKTLDFAVFAHTWLLVRKVERKKTRALGKKKSKSGKMKWKSGEDLILGSEAIYRETRLRRLPVRSGFSFRGAWFLCDFRICMMHQWGLHGPRIFGS